MVKGIWRDLVYSARSLARAKAFTLVCVLSLGIGMVPVIAIPYGTRIFTMPPEGVDTSRLVELVTTAQGPRQPTSRWSYADFLDLRDADTGIALFGWAPGQSDTTTETPGGVETAPISTLFVSKNYFDVLGVRLMRGPGFGSSTQPAVVLTHEFWQQRMAGDAGVIGRLLTLNGVPHVIVGVTPEQFSTHVSFQRPSVYLPLEEHPRLMPRKDGVDPRSDREQLWVNIHGRLAAGVDVAQASAGVSAVTARLATQFPATNEFRAGIAEPYDAFGNLERTQLRIFQAVAFTLTGMVLLVVCLNIAGMMQVRSAMRERELSIRQAIGASRRRLFQFLLSEAVILATLGGLLGSLVLFNLPSLVSLIIGRPFPPEPFRDALAVDPSLVAICIGLCLATSLVFGWLPATRFSRPVIISSLKDDAGGGGLRVGRVHRRTAALQVAIAVPLIVMSGLQLDRVRETATADLGFDAESLYAAPLTLDADDPAGSSVKLRAVQEDLSRAGGVASVTLADGLPLDFRYRLSRVALPVDASAAPRFVEAHITRVGDRYMETMGIPLLRGRGLTPADGAGAEPVTVISQALAAALFPDADAADALGRSLLLGDDEKTRRTLTIVGVAGDFPTSQMSTERAQLLLPLAQHPSPNVFVVARSAPGEPPRRLTAAIEHVMRDLDPKVTRPFATSDGVAYASIVTGTSLRENSVRDFLVSAAVAGGAGSVILMLAALGIYGVVGLMVATRTRELAVRVALGASRRRVVAMILYDVVKLVLPGVAVGLVLTMALMRINGENMGITLSGWEYFAYVTGAAVAVLIAVAASVAPARRAASVQPMIAMRSE